MNEVHKWRKPCFSFSGDTEQLGLGPENNRNGNENGASASANHGEPAPKKTKDVELIGEKSSGSKDTVEKENEHEATDDGNDPDWKPPESDGKSDEKSDNDSTDGNSDDDLGGAAEINSHELAKKAKRAVLGDLTHPCDVQFSKLNL